MGLLGKTGKEDLFFGVVSKDVEVSIFHNYQSISKEDKTYQCNESGENVNQVSNTSKHQKTKFPENHYHSGKVFSKSSNLIVHHYILNQVKTYKGSKCGKPLNWCSRLTQHQTFHNGKKCHKCKQLAKSLALRYYQYMVIHSEQKCRQMLKKNVAKSLSRTTNFLNIRACILYEALEM